MASTDEILAGFATVITARIPNFRVHPEPTDEANPPCVLIKPTGRRAVVLDRSTQILSFDLVVCVPPGRLRAVRSQLYAYLDDTGDRSLEAALLDEPTLGGTVSDILDIQIDPDQFLGSVEIGGLSCPSGVLNVEVMT